MVPGSLVSKPLPSPKFFGFESMVRKLEILASGRNMTADKHKEPPDPPVMETPAAKHVWKPPPSRTTAPTTTTWESIPRLEPPRFTGEDASNWIDKIQRYFNHSYTPESDRLYLVTFLFDPPASDWATYWKENNTEKGWVDFLIAVKHRFDPILYEDDDSTGAGNKTMVGLTDPPAFHSDTRGWELPPSLTQPPTGVVPLSLPRPRFDPPRFEGENVVEWIRNIQMYYNHCYTPLCDRLYLTKYLFDQPASDWMASWKHNHVGGSWEDFLLAVKQRFDPDPYEERVANLRHTSPVDVVTDDGVDLSITSDQQAATCGMSEARDETALKADGLGIYRKAAPNQKPHNSTSDLLVWSRTLSAAVPSAATAARAGQPTDGVGTVLFDGQIIDDKDENLNERKPCSGYKLKDMNGSKIVASDSGDGSTYSRMSNDNFTSRIAAHIVQQAPIIPGDSDHPRLPERQKFVGFVGLSDGDDGSLSSYIENPKFTATPTPLFSDVRTSCVEPITLLGVGNQDVFGHEQVLAFDAHSIPPRKDVTRAGGSLGTGGSMSGSKTANSFLSIESLAQIRMATPRSLGDDPIESVVFKYEGCGALGALHLELEFPSLVAVLSVPPPCPLNLEMERLLDQFTAWMKKQQRENMKQPYRQISVSCPLSAKLSRQFYAPFSVLGWHFNSELYAIIVHKGDTSKVGQYYSFIRLNSTKWYMYDDSRVSAIDGDEVFKQMASIFLYAPHCTYFILAQQLSNGFASLVASQLLSTFELGQGDATVLPHGKDGNGSEADGGCIRLKTTICFVPDSMEQCQNVSLSGANGTSVADTGQSLKSEKNIVENGDESLIAEKQETEGCLDDGSGFLPGECFHECFHTAKRVFEEAGINMACVVLVAYIYESGGGNCDLGGVQDCEELDRFLSKGCTSGGVDARFDVVASIRLFLSKSENSHHPEDIPMNATKDPTVSGDGVPQYQWMILWSAAPATLSWKSKSEMLRHVPSLSLEDKAIAMEGGVDRDSNPTADPATNEQLDRTKPAPTTAHSCPKK